MPRFLIEREIPGVGSLSTEDLRAGARKSNEVLLALAPRAQWQHSYVTGDKIYCVYIAEDEDVIREHARRSGFPCTVISRVNTLIDPTTAETL
jgi:Nickel responsive protein SCO4226-like